MVKVGLIKGRHNMPVENYIFDDSIGDVFDFEKIRKRIGEFIETEVGVELRNGIGINQCDYSDVQCFTGKDTLVVYVTGLTSVVAELISVCANNGVPLTLMHYDVDTKDYIPQAVIVN